MFSYPQMAQQKPPSTILNYPLLSFLAYWRDNGYKLMKPLRVPVTQGWVGTQTLHHPVTLINQASSSPRPSLQTAWHTARSSNVTPCLTLPPGVQPPSASFLYVLWICLFASVSDYCVCLSQRESDWKMFLSAAQGSLNYVVGRRGHDKIITLLIILEKWPSSCVSASVCLSAQGNKVTKTQTAKNTMTSKRRHSSYSFCIEGTEKSFP